MFSFFNFGEEQEQKQKEIELKKKRGGKGAKPPTHIGPHGGTYRYTATKRKCYNCLPVKDFSRLKREDEISKE